MDVRHTRSATRHRISRARSAYVVRHPAVEFVQSAAGKDDRRVFLGADRDGMLLEVMAIQTTDCLLVIHAMPIRNQFRPFLTGDAI